MSNRLRRALDFVVDVNFQGNFQLLLQLQHYLERCALGFPAVLTTLFQALPITRCAAARRVHSREAAVGEKRKSDGYVQS